MRDFKKESSDKIQHEFTKEELINCRKELDKYKQIERTYLRPSGETYTKLITRMEQYMEILGVIRFDETGHKWCKDPAGYDCLSKLESKLDSWDWHKMQEHFEQFPEAKQTHLDYITEIGNKVRGLGNKFKV